MSLNIDVEYLSSASWDEEMPERTRWLRKNDPVRWSEKDGLWIVSRYEEVESVSKNQALFTSELGVRPGNPARIGLIDEGEPRHGELRKLINRGFTPRMVNKLETVFRQITTDSIDAVAAAGECEFVKDIAVPLPLLIIAEMLGIRPEDRDDFHRWSDHMIAADGRFDDPEAVARAGAAFVEYSQYVTKVFEDRRASPQDDLVSILVGAHDDGKLERFDVKGLTSMDDEHVNLANNELIMLCVILLVAGNETTRNALSGGMELLIRNPEERQKLIDDPSLIPSAVEEMVRHVSPVHSFSRTATENTVLRDREIEKGQQILMLYPSANRDEDVYEDPDRFDVTRNPKHLGFGVGSHFCLGANLARMEMRVALEELLRRIPDMEFSHGGPILERAALVRSCVEMRVRFSPES